MEVSNGTRGILTRPTPHDAYTVQPTDPFIMADRDEVAQTDEEQPQTDEEQPQTDEEMDVEPVEQPPGGSRKPRKKRLAFETDPNKRNHIERRTMKAMQTKMDEWYIRTKLPALCLGFRKGEFWIATGVPQLKGFASDPDVQKAFLRHMQVPFSNFSQSVQQVPEDQERETLEDIPPEDFSLFRVVDLRKMIKKAVMKDGRSKPGWGKAACKPVWWPPTVHFTDVNNSRNRPKLEQLVLIMECYRNWNLQDPPEECDMFVDDLTHSPEIPIPVHVASTPAAASVSNPPPPPPEVLASPIGPPAPSSTPATSIFYPPSSPPEVGPPAGLKEIIKRKFGSASIYLGDSWQPVFQTCSDLNETQTSKMLSIFGKLNEDAETHTVITSNIAKNILGSMAMLPWEVNLCLCHHILDHFPHISPRQFISSEDQRRLPERFSRYVPADVYELGLEPFYSSGDGNCFYNSLSILMSGDEYDSVIYRLGAAMYGLAHYEHIVEANVTRLIDRGDALQWAATVGLSTLEVQAIRDQSIQEIVSKTIQSQVNKTLKNFTDIELLQVTFAAGFLKRPLQQHCNLPGAVWYNRKASPPCCFQQCGDVEPFHIIWLPLTGQGTVYNHICPLLPWKCGAVDDYLCVFWRGINQEYPTCNEMVQCLTCLEWYHCICLGISIEEAQDSTIVDCGCTLPSPSQSRNISVYSNQSSVLQFLTKPYLKALTTELLIDKSTPSLRLALNSQPRLVSHRNLMRLIGSGPLRGNAVNALVERMKAVSMPVIVSLTEDLAHRNRLLMDVLLPESIIKYIMEKEHLNYFRASIFFQKLKS